MQHKPDEDASNGIVFRYVKKKGMVKKKETKAPKANSSSKRDEEKKLLEKHPFETMSQIQNRYGSGRQRSGSDGSHQEANRLNH